MTIQEQIDALKVAFDELTKARTIAVMRSTICDTAAEYLRLGHEQDRIQREINRLESEVEHLANV
jgi:hypothetical protein